MQVKAGKKQKTEDIAYLKELSEKRIAFDQLAQEELKKILLIYCKYAVVKESAQLFHPSTLEASISVDDATKSILYLGQLYSNEIDKLIDLINKSTVYIQAAEGIKKPTSNMEWQQLFMYLLESCGELPKGELLELCSVSGEKCIMLNHSHTVYSFNFGDIFDSMSKISYLKHINHN